MRALFFTFIIVFACLSSPGCFGEEERELVCEDDYILTQYEYYECEFSIEEGLFTKLSIEMTNSGESPVNIITFDSDQYAAWVNCEGHSVYSYFTEARSMGSLIEGEFNANNFYVVFDHPDSCQESDDSTPNAEISFRVVASY